MKLKSHCGPLWGGNEEMLCRVHVLEYLCIKRSKLLHSLSFSLRCRDQSTIYNTCNSTLDLKVETVYFSKMLVFTYESIQCHNPQQHNHPNCHENLKSRVYSYYCCHSFGNVVHLLALHFKWCSWVLSHYISCILYETEWIAEKHWTGRFIYPGIKAQHEGPHEN
jgi:hypothetical protein